MSLAKCGKWFPDLVCKVPRLLLTISAQLMLLLCKLNSSMPFMLGADNSAFKHNRRFSDACSHHMRSSAHVWLLMILDMQDHLAALKQKASKLEAMAARNSSDKVISAQVTFGPGIPDNVCYLLILVFVLLCIAHAVHTGQFCYIICS